MIDLATDALERFPKDALAPKFAYLKAVSLGRLDGTNETLRAGMRAVTVEYPGTDIADEAQKVIDLIDGEDPEMKQVEQVERAKALYAYSETAVHYFVWMVDAKENINQLSFDIQVFNLDHFPNIPLDFERNRIGDQHILLTVKVFADLQRAQGYYRSFIMDAEVMKNAMYEYTTFLISESNFAILEEDKKIEDYIEFFKKEYLKQ